MPGEWGGNRNNGAGRNGRGQGAGFGSNGNRHGDRGAAPANSASALHGGGARWSDELDAIFERAPKETTAPKNDDERNFFEERTEVKSHTLTCPNCNQAAEYALTWLVRRKREHPAGFVDEATLARFEKARSYMVRRDDQVACSHARCRKRFEIAGLQSVAFLQDVAAGSVEDRAARVRAAFNGRSRG